MIMGKSSVEVCYIISDTDKGARSHGRYICEKMIVLSMLEVVLRDHGLNWWLIEALWITKMFKESQLVFLGSDVVSWHGLHDALKLRFVQMKWNQSSGLLKKKKLTQNTIQSSGIWPIKLNWKWQHRPVLRDNEAIALLHPHLPPPQW